MSIEIMSQVWKQSRVTDGRQLLALLALADWSDEFGASYPKYAKIATRARVSERQAIRLINDLIKSGEVCNPKVKHNHRSNLFIVLTGAESREDVRARLVNGIKLHGGTIDPISLDNLVESIFALRKGDICVTLNNETSDNEHDTHVTHDHDTDVTPTMTQMSPNPLYIHQPDPSVTDNGVAETTPPPAPSANLPLASDSPQPKTTKDGASKMPLGGTPSPGSAPPPPSAKKERRIKSEFYDHPFVAVWRDVFRLNLPEAKMVQLAKEVVTPPKLAQWRAACEAWVLRPYDPSNIGGILDWYRDPSRYQNHHPPRRGQSPVVPPPTPYKPKSQAEIDEYLANSPIIED